MFSFYANALFRRVFVSIGSIRRPLFSACDVHRSLFASASRLCYLFLVLCGTAWATSINYVQSNYATPQSPQSTVKIKYKSAQAAGDLNIVVVGWNDSTATVKSISDTVGNIYLLAVGPASVRGALTQSIYVARNIKPTAAGINTVTVTFSTAAVYPDIRVLEYSGADPNTPVDAAATNTGSSTTSSVSLATTNAADLIFAANIVQSATLGPGSGFTERLLTKPDSDIAEDMISSQAGIYSATAPINVAYPWVMQAVALRTPSLSSGSGASGPPASLSGFSCTNSSETGSGTDACTITLNSVAGGNGFTVGLASNDSSVSIPSSVTVPAGATSASFSAMISAVSSAQTATLTASGGGVSKSFTLRLNPVTATLNVNATNIAFGNVTENTTATQSLTLTSSGTAPITVNSAAISGPGFSYTGSAFPLMLSPNQTATLTVDFDPTSAGAMSGQLTINSNSSVTPTSVVSLTGTGVATAYSVSLTWNAPAGSPDPVAGYHVYRSPSGNSNYQLLSSVSDTTLVYADNTVQNGQVYDYIVESVDPSGNESGPSNMASVSIP